MVEFISVRTALSSASDQGKARPHRHRNALGDVDDGGVPDEPTGSAEQVTFSGDGGQAANEAPRRRGRYAYWSVAACRVTLDIVTKVRGQAADPRASGCRSSATR